MKSCPVILLALSLLAFVCPVHGQEALTDAEKALFDDLQVTEEAEKSARQRIEKSETPPEAQPELPATAAKMLDRLAVFEASLLGITDEAIALSRKALSAQLIKLSDTAADPAKTELIATAKNIEGLKPEAELPAAGAGGDFPGEWIYPNDSRWYYRDGNIKTNAFTGKWRWLNQSDRVVVADYAGSEYVDVLRLVTRTGKPPMLEGINQKANHWTLSRGQSDPGKPALPAEANKIIASAGAHESKVRAASLKQTRDKRERVAAWLVEKAKTDSPAAAKVLLENAGKLRAVAAGPATSDTRRNADAFRGKIYLDNKRRPWEFLPDGTVRCNGLSWGMWEWAKSGNDDCLIICSGGPGKAENPMLVCQSRSSPGTMHFIGFEDKFDAKLRQ